jgi:hypothetical protein
MLFNSKIHDFRKFNIIHGSLVPKVVSGIYCKTLHFCRLIHGKACKMAFVLQVYDFDVKHCGEKINKDVDGLNINPCVGWCIKYYWSTLA